MESDYTCRFYRYEDYEMVCEWQRARGLEPYVESFLPSCGFVVEDKDGPIIASWLFFDSSTPVCFIGYTVINPRLDFYHTRKAFEFLIKRQMAEGWLGGARALMAYMPKAFAWHEGYLEDLGFHIDKKPLINMVIQLKEEDAELCLSTQ